MTSASVNIRSSLPRFNWLRTTPPERYQALRSATCDGYEQRNEVSLADRFDLRPAQ